MTSSRPAARRAYLGRRHPLAAREIRELWIIGESGLFNRRIGHDGNMALQLREQVAPDAASEIVEQPD